MRELENFFTSRRNNIAIILKASQAVTSPSFTVKSLASLGGRMDLVARAIISSFMTKKGLRKNIFFISVFEGPPNPPLVFMIDGTKFESYSLISEKDVGEIILKALKGESQNGVFIQKENFRNIVNFFLQRLKRNQIVYLHEKGVDIRRIPISRLRDSKVFILGDHKGIDKKDERWLVTKEISMVSIGPISYLSSHSITIVLEEIFRAQENL
ncbi:MAG: hypothetical protein DRJ64_01565 [Thermoprotei archaeon]|nr:MAG: hypothetical protein DRJ64_01565 [Thermoprotei archaeon]